MKVIILAGGKGTRMLEETKTKPKALVEVGGRPIIRYIMDWFQNSGFNDFLILTGYKSEHLFRYFSSIANIIFQDEKRLTVHTEDFSATLLNTGKYTGSAQRLFISRDYIDSEDFMLTYCDGICSVNLEDLLRFHQDNKALVTLTAVKPAPRFGVLEINSTGVVTNMREKSKSDVGFINGGYMVLKRSCFDYITESTQNLESDLLESIVPTGRLIAYRHFGFWQCMDTLYEKKYLDSLIQNDKLPWLNRGYYEDIR